MRIELETGCILLVYFTTWRSQETMKRIELEPECFLPVYFTTWRSQDSMRRIELLNRFLRGAETLKPEMKYLGMKTEDKIDINNE